MKKSIYYNKFYMIRAEFLYLYFNIFICCLTQWEIHNFLYVQSVLVIVHSHVFYTYFRKFIAVCAVQFYCIILSYLQDKIRSLRLSWCAASTYRWYFTWMTDFITVSKNKVFLYTPWRHMGVWRYSSIHS